jgi:hypothetical protein
MPVKALRSLALAALATCGLSAGDAYTLSTPLVWKPTSALAETTEKLNLLHFAQAKIAILPLVDNRKEKSLLAENREKVPFRTVGTPDDVAAYLTRHAIELFQEAGLPVTDKADGATVVVSGELLRFGATEESTYKGELRALLQVRAGDKLLWKGMAVGRASRFGRSFKLENYHEVLSDCLVAAVSRLLSDQVFTEVLAGRAMVVALPAAN